MPSARDAGRITRSQTRTFGRASAINTNVRNRRSARGVRNLGVRLRTSAVTGLELLDSLISDSTDRSGLSTRFTGRSTRERRVRQGGSTLNRSSGSPEPSLIDNTIMIATPPSRNVQVVDLDSWNPPPPTSTTVNRTRRPLEVDLTCELDDEVFVVLEDIINPSRRPPANPLPVELVGHSSRTEMNAATSTRRDSAVSTGQTTVTASSVSTSTSTSSTRDATTGIQCPICLDTLPQMKAANHQLHSTTCGHLFCHPCIMQVISNTKHCPTCRQLLTVKKIHPIFI